MATRLGGFRMGRFDTAVFAALLGLLRGEVGFIDESGRIVHTEGDVLLGNAYPVQKQPALPMESGQTTHATLRRRGAIL